MDRKASFFPTFEKHFTLSLKATPRGSKPTTSKRSVTAGLRMYWEK